MYGFSPGGEFGCHALFAEVPTVITDRKDDEVGLVVRLAVRFECFYGFSEELVAVCAECIVVLNGLLFLGVAHGEHVACFLDAL